MAQLPKLTLGRLKEFVAQHSPVLHMHPRDAFMPCSVEWFMDHSELWLLEKENGSPDRRLLAQGEVTGIGMAACECQHGGSALQLRLHPSAKQGPPMEEICKTPLYANAKWVLGKDGSAEAIEIQYLTFYAHNGWYDIGYLGLLKVGAHDGDWEHLTIRISPDTGALQGVYCNAHRSQDGCWVDSSQVERTVEGRLKIYVARHGHGTYPKGGVWWRAGLMANDLTSHKGAIWKADTVYLLPQLQPTDEACQAAATHDAAEALPQLATHMEEVAEQDRPVQTPSEQQAFENKEVAVLQHFISSDSSLSPRHQQSRRQNISPGAVGGNALRDEEEVILMKVPSRGSKLQAPSSSKQAFSGEGVQVLQHSGEWLSFLGQWGTTPSPAAQAWFWTAEPPVSRGTLLRIIGHPWPETKSL